MIMELLDAFGIATGGAPGFEADDVLGTLAARERRDPVVVVSGDRDLLQVVDRRSGRGAGALPRPRAGQGDAVRPGRGRRALRRARRPGRRRLRRTGAAARRSVRRPARCARHRREDRGHAAGPARLAGGHPGGRGRPEVDCAKGDSDQAARGRRLHGSGGAGGAGRHRRDRHAVDTPPTRCRWRPPTPTRRRTGRRLRRRLLDRPAAEGAGRAARLHATCLLRAGRPRRCRLSSWNVTVTCAWCRRC